MTRWFSTASVAGLTILALAPLVPATAMTTTLPAAVENGCGSRLGNYAACVTVQNSTRGYTGPNVVNASAGLLFNATFSVQGNAGRAAGAYALGSASDANRDVVNRGNGWVAYRCQVSWPNLYGCRTEVTSSVTNPVIAPAVNPPPGSEFQSGVFNAQRGARLTSWGQVNFRAAATNSCGIHSKYVSCRLTNTQGSNRDWTRFNFALTNELVTISVDNTLANYRMVLDRAPSWDHSIEDRRGRSSNATDIAPGGQAFWGAIRPTDKNKTHITLEYVLVGLTSRDVNFNGAHVRVRVDFDKDGNLIRTGSADDAHGPEACRVIEARANQRPTCTVLNASGWVPGQTRLLVSISGRG